MGLVASHLIRQTVSLNRLSFFKMKYCQRTRQTFPWNPLNLFLVTTNSSSQAERIG